MANTSIEWTDKTWNPITGCTKISAGCTNCYAEIMARRLKGMGKPKYKDGFKVTIHYDALAEPTKWKNPQNIFVCSMGDLFHENVPYSFVDEVISVINETPQHRYQILTKRAERMEEYFSNKLVPKNAWLGVTVDVKESKKRIDHLRNLDATIKFLSCEPLLEDLCELNLNGIDWVIVGGESGAKARPMKEEWLLNIKKQADVQEIPFFFKQWGTWGNDGIKRNKKANGKLLGGNIYQSMPKTKR